jgi:hypothetical protein
VWTLKSCSHRPVYFVRRIINEIHRVVLFSHRPVYSARRIINEIHRAASECLERLRLAGGMPARPAPSAAGRRRDEAHAEGRAGGAHLGLGRNCRFVPPLIHFVPDLLTYIRFPVPLFLNRQDAMRPSPGLTARHGQYGTSATIWPASRTAKMFWRRHKPRVGPNRGPSSGL